MKLLFAFLFSFIFCAGCVYGQVWQESYKQGLTSFKEGKYNEAMQALTKARTKLNPKKKKNYRDYAMVTNMFGKCYLNNAQNKEAEQYIMEAKTYFEMSKILQDGLYADILYNLASTYQQRGGIYYTKVDSLLGISIEIIEKMSVMDTVRYINYLGSLGESYRLQNKLENAQKSFEKVIKLSNQKSIEYILDISNLARLYLTFNSLEGYQKAEEIFKKGQSIIENSDIKYKGVGTFYNSMADMYMNMNQVKESEKYYKKSYEILTKNKDNNVFYPIKGLADLYSRNNALVKADSIYKVALEIIKNTQGNTSNIYAQTLQEFAGLHIYKGLYWQPTEIYKDALRIFEKNNGIYSREYALCLTDLGVLYQYQENYYKSDSTQRKAIEIKEKIMDKNSLEYAYSLNYLGDLYSYMERYQESEKLLNRAKEITKQKINENFGFYFTVVSNLGKLYNAQSLFTKGIQLYESILEKTKQIMSEESQEYVIFLSNLAALYEAIKNHEKSIQLNLKSLTLKEKIYGNKLHPEYGISLSFLAASYENNNEFEKALKTYQECAQIALEKQGNKSNNYLNAMNGIAVIYSKTGKSGEAKKIHENILKVRLEIDGEFHKNYTRAANNYAVFCINKDKYEEAINFSNIAVRNSLREINILLPAISEKDRKEYLNNTNKYFRNYELCIFLLMAKNKNMLHEYLNYRLQLKKIIMQTNQKMILQIRQTNDKEIMTKLSEWTKQRNTLAKLLTLSEVAIKNRKIDLTQEAEKLEKLEKELASQSTEFAKLSQKAQEKPATWQDIQKRLQE